jgi:asparagine synthase (glutamine-hydrolysing)
MPLEETCFKKIKIFKNGILNTYSLRNKKLKNHLYDNPLNWITETKYKYLSNMKETELINLFDYKLNKQAKMMIPRVNFGCIVSGGIDSSLQAAILSQYKEPHQNLVIDHGSKDLIMRHINKFNFYFERNIKKIKLNKQKYISLAHKCYKIVSSPLQTHDLPGRLEISKFFRKNNCKVFFSADGCDELMGGQQLYYKIYNKRYNFKVNQSPYSSLIKSNIINPSIHYENFLNNSWKNILEKYQFIKSKKEKNIQSSLFLDYFIQSVGVGNRSNDLISCNSSVEPRNIFISKEIIKFILNLPLKYKINFKEKNINFKQKYLLKKIFCKYYDSKLIFSKQGFSGFPNSLIKSKKFLLTKKIINNKPYTTNNSKNYYDKRNLRRDLNWKFINCEKFLQYFL